MRELLWAMLSHQKNPQGILVISDERTADALVRRGILRKDPSGYELNENEARLALAKAAS
jgi:hypothetical protein